MSETDTARCDAFRASSKRVVRVGVVGVLSVLLSACGGGSVERNLLNVVKAEYEGKPNGCMMSVSIIDVRRFPVRNFGFRNRVNQDFAVLVSNGLIDVSQVRQGNSVGEEFRLTPAGERYFQAGQGLCFADLAVNRLVNVSAPFEERGRTHMTATAEIAVSVPDFALQDRFIQFVRGHGNGFFDMLTAARAGQPYRVDLTFVSTDDGWQIQ